MEIIACNVECRHLVVANLYALFVDSCVERAFDSQSRFRGCCADQLDDCDTIHEWAATPVLCDVAEHAVLDLVPLCAVATYAERSNAQEPYGSCLKDDGGPIGGDFQE